MPDQPSPMEEISVPVLVVGGGGCGLSASSFLSDLGVDHLLVERHESTSLQPKAHYLNQRTMEVYRQHGIADSVYEVGAPLEQFSRVRWNTTLGGDGDLDGRTYLSMETFGGGSLAEVYDRDSACRATRYPQMRLEPLLRRHAEERAPGRIRFGHELVEFDETAAGVRCLMRDLAEDREYVVTADYVVGADGGKTFGPALEIPMDGPKRMLDMVSVHFTADLSEWWEDGIWATLFISPDVLDSWGSGNAIQHGPTWGRHSEEWVVHFAFRPDDPDRFDEDSMIPRLRGILKLPDLDLEVHQISHWIVDRIVARNFGTKRIFLAGDSAHRQPPTSGLGLNTAVLDAHNLAWKLAAVTKGQAGAELLETYEAERRPIAIANADWALMMFKNHGVIDAGLGISRGATVEENQAALREYFADTPLGESLRARAEVAISTQAMEFHDHAIEIGFRYDEGALVTDGTEPPPRDPLGKTYVPTTRPGHRLPHAWLQHDGERISTHDVTEVGSFGLLVARAEDWAEVAGGISKELGIEVGVHGIGPGQDYADVDGRWAEIGEMGDGVGILVRPDNHVGWRGTLGDGGSELRDAVGRILRWDLDAVG